MMIVRPLNLIIVLISLAVVCYSANISINQVGDVNVSYDGKTFVCDDITCPKSSETCVVSKKTLSNDTTKFERWARCLSNKNEITFQTKNIYNSPDPNSHIDFYLEHSIHGGTFLNDSTVQKALQNAQNQLQFELQKMQEELAKAFNFMG